jgi:hypothetical protein
MIQLSPKVQHWALLNWESAFNTLRDT